MTVGEIPKDVSEELINISTQMMGAMIRNDWADVHRHLYRYNRVYTGWWQLKESNRCKEWMETCQS